MFPNSGGIHNPVVLLITSWVTGGCASVFPFCEMGKIIVLVMELLCEFKEIMYVKLLENVSCKINAMLNKT